MKLFIILLLLVGLTIHDINGRSTGGGRGGGSRGGGSRGGGSRGGGIFGKSSTPHTSSKSPHTSSKPSTPAKTSTTHESVQKATDVHTNFLNAERGGAMPPHKSKSSSAPSAPPADTHLTSKGSFDSNSNDHLFSPPVPKETTRKNTSPFVHHTPTSSTAWRPHQNPSGVNHTSTSSWQNPYLNTNPPPTSPGIGFKPDVLPGHTQFNGNSHPTYPIYDGSRTMQHGSYPSTPPIGNPYSVHQPAGSPNGGYYPPQQHTLGQPMAQPFVPGHTVIVVPGQQDSGSGLGQIVKEALVYSTVNAGVNHLMNSYLHRNDEPSRTGTSGTNTTIIHNNYYNTNITPGTNDGSGRPTNTASGSAPAVPGRAENPGAGTTPANTMTGSSHQTNTQTTGNGGGNQSTVPPLLYRISDEELMKLSEKLFKMSPVNVSEYVKLNLQYRTPSTDGTLNITDVARMPLFIVDREILDHPTIQMIRALYDNYERNATIKENRTLEKQMEQTLFIDGLLYTSTMSAAMKWLSDNYFIDPDDFEWKDTLKSIWFTQFGGSTSGFERVFVHELYPDQQVLGIQDWIYFEYLESLNRINYMGYVDKLDLGKTASLLKLNYEVDGIIQRNGTIFVGTLPELEMALYTVCFYARPSGLCPISLGGTKFYIYNHSFRYFGKDLIDFASHIF